MSAAPAAASTASARSDRWPALPLERWRDTYQTVHLWTQIVGKTRLALAPAQNHCWQTALYVTARGLGTSPMPCGDGRTLEVDFDFVAQRLVARTSDGRAEELALEPCAVADFFRRYRRMLGALGVRARISSRPCEIAGSIPFREDRVHGAYDAAAAHDAWRILVQVDRVLEAFRARFVGKCSPVHFWWGAFDIACTRFSGARAPLHPGGIPNLADRVTRDAYSHACISAGWWPGTPGSPVAEPAFYAYSYPEPPGCPDAPIAPAPARWHPAMHEWILPYDAVREAADPDAAALEFFESTYAAAAGLAGWDRAALERQG